MTDTTTDKHIYDVEDPQFRRTSVEFFRRHSLVPRLLDNFTAICIVVFICILLVLAAGTGLASCPGGICKGIPSLRQHSNNESIVTADALLSYTGPQELQHYDDPHWQQEQASQLASAWGFLSGQLLFASVAEPGTTVNGILESGVGQWAGGTPALVAAVLGNSAPHRCACLTLSPVQFPDISQLSAFVVALVAAPSEGAIRRAADEQFFSLVPLTSPEAADLGRILPIAAINRASAGLEAVLGRRLYPFTLEVRTFESRSNSSTQPYAVYEVSTGSWNMPTGRIVLDDILVGNLIRFPTDLSSGLTSFAESLFSQVGVSSLDVVGAVTAKSAVIAAGMAISYQVPIWFCVACPVVLGLLAPLVINAGAGAVANAACEHYHLPDADCAELWWSALAVAMILSIASAIPIVFICKLPECARPKQA